MTTSTELTGTIARLAAAHGLVLDESSITINEMGLDFRVAIARTTTGERWVLRIPRRPDVMERADVEGRLLRLVAHQLSVQVPDWQVASPDLIAYPLLPGLPGLELDEHGEPEWRVDASSLTYAADLGDVLAQLHRIDTADAEATGIPCRTPADVRQGWRDDLATVTQNFTVAEELIARWTAWLDDDSYWPTWSVLTHGEVYPGHVLVNNDRITGILDWTTAEVSDPARDFQFQQAVGSPEAFATTVKQYVASGGRVWPRLADHCAEMFSAAPLRYGLYALITDDEQHLQAAAGALVQPTATDG